MALGGLSWFRGRRPATLVCIVTLLLSSAAAGAATVTVTTTADDLTPNDGSVSLREALTAINAGNDLGDPDITAQSPGVFGTADTINFNIAGAGVHTIAPATNLPTITKAVLINGYSQPGSSANTTAFPLALNAVLLIEMNFASTGGLVVSASGTTIRGLVMNRGSDAIEITTGNNVTVAGNFIGTNPAGTVDMPGVSGGFGVRVDGGNNHHIGGPAPADRNLLSGNRQGGIFVGLAANDSMLIQGNFIGTDITGTVSLNSVIGVGMLIRGTTTNTALINNLISGNKDGSVEFGSNGGVIQGNLIGTQRDGITPLPNGNFGGIDFSSTSSGVTVGGSGAGQPNVIAFNIGFGIILQGGVGILISQNSIYGNANLGISFGVKPAAEPNDNCDADTGPNNRQNYPVITSAVISAGNVTISGTLNSTASTDFHLEFFSNAVCDPTGNGQGQTFLGSANVTTPVGNCNTSFGPLVFPVPPGQTVFTATADDFQNSSEFSACFASGGVAPTATPTPTPTLTATPIVPPTSTPPGPTSTPIQTPAAGGVSVPTLQPWALALFALAISGAALWLVRRS